MSLGASSNSSSSLEIRLKLSRFSYRNHIGLEPDSLGDAYLAGVMRSRALLRVLQPSAKARRSKPRPDTFPARLRRAAGRQLEMSRRVEQAGQPSFPGHRGMEDNCSPRIGSNGSGSPSSVTVPETVVGRC